MGSSRGAALCVLAILTTAAMANPARADSPLKPGRVLLFDLQADDEAEPHLAQAREAIELLVASHAGFEPVASAVMRRALTERQATEPACATSDICRRFLARALHADLVVSGSLRKQSGRFVLALDVAPANTLDLPRTTSESMKHIKNLAANVKLCLDRLFLWNEAATPPPTTVAESLPATTTEPPPPAATPATPPPATPVALTPPRPKDKRPVLALLTVRAGTGFTDAELSSVEEGLLSALEETARFQVVGRTDIATLLDLETKKQMVGCNEDTGCMTAIAGSLGADYVASANVGRLGTAIQLTFKVIDARTAAVLVHARQTVNTDRQLVTAANEISDEVVRAVFGAGTPLPKHKNIVAAPEERTLHGVGIGATVVGGLALVAATVLGVVAHNDTTAARARATAPLQTEINTVNTMALSSDALFGAGGAVAAVGVGLTVAF